MLAIHAVNYWPTIQTADARGVAAWLDIGMLFI